MNSTVQKFFSDLWMVNLQEGANIVACRAPWERNTVGRNFSEMLEKEEYERLSAYLMSYEMKPRVSETLDGQILIVIPSLMPSATLAVVLVPQIERKILLRFLAKRSGIALCWNERLAEEASGRMPGGVAKEEEALGRLVWEIEALSFSALAPSRRAKNARIDEFLKRRVGVLSELAGCEVTIGEWKELRNSESFDFGMFTSYLLLSLLMFRTAAHRRCAVVGMEEGVGENERYLTVCADCEELGDGLSWEIGTLETLTEDRLMLFGTRYRDGTLLLRMIPRRIDVSYLGLKASQRFQ